MEYITPTKENPVFVADNDYFGYIEGVYKDYKVDNGENSSVGATFGTSFTQAVNDLHEWIKEADYLLKEHPKSKFSIYAVSGEMGKYDQPRQIKVYTISAAKAKKYLL